MEHTGKGQPLLSLLMNLRASASIRLMNISLAGQPAGIAFKVDSLAVAPEVIKESCALRWQL
ncbi:MAG: hypothetical protein IPL01_05815 [Acidobacteria bacterium]|nr:hypothetical protein [Acidobacteriota bacterium]